MNINAQNIYIYYHLSCPILLREMITILAMIRQQLNLLQEAVYKLVNLSSKVNIELASECQDFLPQHLMLRLGELRRHLLVQCFDALN